MNVDVCDGALNVDESERLWRYSAPELISQIKPTASSIATDCYALGCLLWEVLTCQELWHGLSQAQVRALMQRRLRPPISEFFAPHVSALLYECWSELPAERPLPAEILYRLAGGKNAAYMFLPNSSARSSLRHSRLQTSLDSQMRPKSVTWALPPVRPLETNAEGLNLQMKPPSDGFDIPNDLQNSQPLNVPEQKNKFDHVFSHASPRSSLAQSSSETLVPGQVALQMRIPPHACSNEASHESPGRQRTTRASASAVTRPAAAATRFSLHLNNTAPETGTTLEQKQKHDLAVTRAAEHMRVDSKRIIQPETPAATHSQLALHVSSAAQSSPQPLQVSVQQPDVPQLTKIGAFSGASCQQSPRDLLASVTQAPLIEHSSPSKPSMVHYDAASSIAAHVLAAKQLQSSRSDATADARRFERSV